MRLFSLLFLIVAALASSASAADPRGPSFCEELIGTTAAERNNAVKFYVAEYAEAGGLLTRAQAKLLGSEMAYEAEVIRGHFLMKCATAAQGDSSFFGPQDQSALRAEFESAVLTITEAKANLFATDPGSGPGSPFIPFGKRGGAGWYVGGLAPLYSNGLGPVFPQ